MQTKSEKPNYFGAGVRKAPVQTSLLESTSRWLNDAGMRDVLAVWMLRRNGPDFPVEADHTLGMREATERVQSVDEIEDMLIAERRINPALDAWFEEGFVSTYTNEDFAQYAPETVGGLIYHQIRHNGFDMTMGQDWNTLPRPTTNYGYFRLRGNQTHDLEHVITGSQFNSIGELVDYFVRLSNLHKHLSPELASALSTYRFFGAMRMLSRAMLHYPDTWMKVLETIQQGIRVGLASDPIYTIKYEDILHLTPEAAREKVGVREVYEVDTEAASIIFREEAAEAAE